MSKDAHSEIQSVRDGSGPLSQREATVVAMELEFCREAVRLIQEESTALLSKGGNLGSWGMLLQCACADAHRIGLAQLKKQGVLGTEEQLSALAWGGGFQVVRQVLREGSSMGGLISGRRTRQEAQRIIEAVERLRLEAMKKIARISDG